MNKNILYPNIFTYQYFILFILLILLILLILFILSFFAQYTPIKYNSLDSYNINLPHCTDPNILQNDGDLLCSNNYGNGFTFKGLSNDTEGCWFGKSRGICIPSLKIPQNCLLPNTVDLNTVCTNLNPQFKYSGINNFDNCLLGFQPICIQIPLNNI